MSQDFRVNDDVMTPNGPGVIQAVMYDHGYRYIVVRHVIEKMTQSPSRRCLTPKAIELPGVYKTGLWYYDPSEVTHAHPVP